MKKIKLKNHNFTRMDLLKSKPWWFFIGRFIAEAITFGGAYGVLIIMLVGTYNDREYIMMGIAILMFISFTMFVVSTGVKPFMYLLDILFFQVYEIDMMILGSRFESNTWFCHTRLLQIISFRSLPTDFTTQELCKHLARVHYVGTRWGLYPIEVIDLTMSQNSRMDLYKAIGKYSKAFPGGSLGTFETLSKNYGTKIDVGSPPYRKLEKYIEKDPQPFLEIFDKLMPTLGKMRKYTADKKYISMVTLNDEERAKILLYEIYAHSCVYEDGYTGKAVARSRL